MIKILDLSFYAEGGRQHSGATQLQDHKENSTFPYAGLFLNHKKVCGDRGKIRTSHLLYNNDLFLVQHAKQKSRNVQGKHARKKDWEKNYVGKKKKQFLLQLYHVPSIKAQ